MPLRIDALKKNRRDLYNFRNSIGMRKDRLEYHNTLYGHVTEAIEAINKIIAIHAAQTRVPKLSGRERSFATQNSELETI